VNDKVIIVGTDGTETGSAAVRWAAREANRRAVPLRIVHACDPDWQESRFDIGNEYLDVTGELAEAVVGAARARAGQAAPGIDIRTEVLIGDTVPRLLAASRDAELLVLGRPGRGSLGGLLLGSASPRMATRAPCPVVVVRGRDDAAGPIAAGVDDSPAADSVLETAFAAAADLGCPTIVVRSYLPVIPLMLSGTVSPSADIPGQEAAARDRLEKRLEPWRARFPHVPVQVLLTQDSAATALVKESRRARLVIVGSHGHGVLAGTVLRATGLQLLHGADCPVHIILPATASHRIGDLGPGRIGQLGPGVTAARYGIVESTDIDRRTP
jgi:nucleotide-binding universal stress UspA family protein